MGFNSGFKGLNTDAMRSQKPIASINKTLMPSVKEFQGT